MCSFANAVLLLFLYETAIPVNELELHHILFYLAYNNRLIIIQPHKVVVKLY